MDSRDRSPVPGVGTGLSVVLYLIDLHAQHAVRICGVTCGSLDLSSG